MKCIQCALYKGTAFTTNCSPACRVRSLLSATSYCRVATQDIFRCSATVLVLRNCVHSYSKTLPPMAMHHQLSRGLDPSLEVKSKNIYSNIFASLISVYCIIICIFNLILLGINYWIRVCSRLYINGFLHYVIQIVHIPCHH